MNAKVKTLSAAAAKAVTTYTSNRVGTDKKQVSMVDILSADGVTSDMCKAPAKGEDRTFFDSLKVAVVAGFTAQVRGLLAKPAKGLNANQKKDRLYWQQQIGSVCKDIRRALEKREKKAAEAEAAANGETEEKKAEATQESKWRETLSNIIKQAQAAEGVQVKDVSAFIKDLKSAVARIQ
jgi:hypothetical protein